MRAVRRTRPWHVEVGWPRTWLVQERARSADAREAEPHLWIGASCEPPPFLWLPFGSMLLARRASRPTRAVALGAGGIGLALMADTGRKLAADEYGGTEYMLSVLALSILAGVGYLLAITIIAVRQANARRRAAHESQRAQIRCQTPNL